MLLIKEDMQLLKDFDKGNCKLNSYMEKLGDLLYRQERSVQNFRNKISN